jgi:hypothetical protein
VPTRALGSENRGSRNRNLRTGHSADPERSSADSSRTDHSHAGGPAASRLRSRRASSFLRSPSTLMPLAPRTESRRDRRGKTSGRRMWRSEELRQVTERTVTSSTTWLPTRGPATWTRCQHQILVGGLTGRGLRRTRSKMQRSTRRRPIEKAGERSERGSVLEVMFDGRFQESMVRTSCVRKSQKRSESSPSFSAPPGAPAA